MKRQTYPVLRRLRGEQFDNSVVLTFNADLAFYEHVILPTLGHSCCNNIVLMDLRQYERALLSSMGLIRGLGRRYGVCAIPATSSFHPKIVLLCGADRGR
jgi:hypothetical protein